MATGGGILNIFTRLYIAFRGIVKVLKKYASLKILRKLTYLGIKLAERQNQSEFFYAPFGEIDLNQIEVLVKDKKTAEKRTMTYKSYQDLTHMFELIGQCDQEGNLIPGDPNLNPRHQKVQAKDVAVHAVDSGENTTRVEPIIPEKFREIYESKQAERKKPGPKPKVVTA